MQRLNTTEFFLTFIVLALIAVGQLMIYNGYTGAIRLPLGYKIAMAAYLVVVTVLFCLFINWERFSTFGKPLRTLSEAANQVADGNFDVELSPAEGKDRFIVSTFSDFNKMVAELGTIETLKNDFISNVSHEIKTPLAIVQNYALALQDENLSAAQRKDYAATVAEATERLNGLVTNILKLSKLENQKVLPEKTTFDLCGQLTDCVLQFDEMLTAKSLQFDVQLLEEEERVMIHTDKSMLELVWNNLLGNAVKFTEPGGRISLKQVSDENSVRVTISDTGCGMSEATVRRIFDKFYQGDTSHAQEGTGLGLAMVYRVITLLEGTIRVESELGKGSSFTVCLKKNI